MPWQEDVAAKHNAVLADMERIKGDKLELEKELRKVSQFGFFRTGILRPCDGARG